MMHFRKNIYLNLFLHFSFSGKEHQIVIYFNPLQHNLNLTAIPGTDAALDPHLAGSLHRTLYRFFFSVPGKTIAYNQLHNQMVYRHPAFILNIDFHRDHLILRCHRPLYFQAYTDSIHKHP